MLFVTTHAHAQTCDPFQDGLVAHWMLDEGSGTFADATGNGNTGTAAGGVSYASTGVIDNAAGFDGADNTDISGTSSFSNLEKFTIAGWIYPTGGASSAYERVFYKGYAGGFPSFIYRSDTGAIRLEQDWTSNFGVWETSEAVPLSQWTHIAVTYDVSSVANDPVFYINGVQTSAPSEENAPVGTQDTDNNNFYIGNRSAGDRPFDGWIDDLRVYERILPAEEIQALYETRSNADPVEGEIVFNLKNSSLQYCDGTDWRMAGTGSWNPPAAEFDGSNDYFTKTSLDNVSDSNKWTGSFWFRNDDFAENDWRFILDTNTPGDLSLDWHGHVSDRMLISAQNSSSTTVLSMYSDPVSDDEWHHMMFSVDLSDTTKRHIYIDDVEAIQSVSTYNTSGIMDFTTPSYGIGGRNNNNNWNGGLADLWLDFGTYIDLSVESNRRKFISEKGMPMYLGQNGTIPTGDVPEIFLSGDAVTFISNRGTGGAFTPQGSAELTNSASQPGTCTPSAGPFVLEDTYSTNMDAHRVWGDGRYIYVVDQDGGGAGGVKAFSFDGSTLSGPLDTYDPGWAWDDITSDGTYIYATDDWGYIAALTFDGTSFTEHAAPQPADNWYENVWTDGTYIYATDYGDGIDVFTFDGSSFSLIHETNDGRDYDCITGDGTYIYACEPGNTTEYGMAAFSFDGSTLTFLNNINTGQLTWSYSAHAQGGYIYVGTNPKFFAISFDGTNFSIDGDSGYIASNSYAWDVFSDGTYVYALDDRTALDAFTFDGSSFTGPISTSGTPVSQTFGSEIWGDGTYMYVADGTAGLRVFSGFGGCNCGTNTRGEITPKGTVQYNGNFNVMEYCNGTDWVAMGPVGGTPPTDGLIHHWKLDETEADGTTAVDSVGALNGTWSGTDINGAEGVVDGAIQFESGTYMHIAMTGFDPPTQGTLSFWAYDYTAKTDTFRRIIGADDAYEVVIFADNTIQNDIGENGGSVGSTTAIAPETWYHIVATHNFTTGDKKIYINGVLEGSDTDGTTDPGGSLELRLAHRTGAANNQHWESVLDDVRIYDRELSPTEINQLYNFGLSRGLGDVSGGCSNPTRAEGVMIYNTNHNNLQYCNGEEWVKVGY